MLLVYLILSFVVKLIVERIRQRFPKIDGDLVIAVAVAVSFVICAAFGLTLVSTLAQMTGYGDALINPWLDYGLSAVCITGGSAFVNELTRKQRGAQ